MTGASVFELATVALVVTKVLVVPESAIADSCFVKEQHHESFECASVSLEFKFCFNLTHLVVLHSILCCLACHFFSSSAQKACFS